MLPTIENVAGQAAEGKIGPAQEHEDQPCDSNDSSQYEEQLPEIGHGYSLEHVIFFRAHASTLYNSPMKRVLFLGYVLACAVAGIAQSSEKPAVVDAGLGRCSLDITVLGPDSKPVYAASVKVHIAYGFGGFHKLDLEVGTNADGKAKFTGLPSRVRRPPLEFDASKDDLSGSLNYDPATECVAAHSITVQKTAPTTTTQ